MRPDGRDVRAFESDLGEAVLRDLDGGTGLLHLRAQLLHVGDREASIVGHDDHARVREHAVERRDELAFCCSIHWALSGWTDLGPPVAPVAQGPSACASSRLKRRSRKPCPPGHVHRTRRARWFEPNAPFRVRGGEFGLPRLCRPFRIKPEGRARPGACSLGQDIAGPGRRNPFNPPACHRPVSGADALHGASRSAAPTYFGNSNRVP